MFVKVCVGSFVEVREGFERFVEVYGRSWRFVAVAEVR